MRKNMGGGGMFLRMLGARAHTLPQAGAEESCRRRNLHTGIVSSTCSFTVSQNPPSLSSRTNFFAVPPLCSRGTAAPKMTSTSGGRSL